MLERAVVVETSGKIAVIEASRASMCEGCHKLSGDGSCAGHCEISGLVAGNGKTVRTRAVNSVGAVVGDKVSVEADSRRMVGYAALVFILPILVCALFYYVGNLIFSTMAGSVLSSVLGFVLTFVGIGLFDKSKRNKEPDIRIVKVLDAE